MNFKPLRSYDTYIPAHLNMQQLEAEGIHAVLQDEYTVTIDPILTNAVGGIKLMVPEMQWERAEALMREIEDNYRKSARCPKCGAHGPERVADTGKGVNWFSSLMSWFFASYAVPVTYKYRCFTCGHEMDQLPDLSPDA